MTTQPGFDEVVSGVNAALAEVSAWMWSLRNLNIQDTVSGLWFRCDGSRWLLAAELNEQAMIKKLFRVDVSDLI
jgi:hypothetical protein